MLQRSVAFQKAVVHVLLCTALLFGGLPHAGGQEPGPVKAKPLGYFYCPECGKEIVCPPGKEEAHIRCPYCTTKEVFLQYSAQKRSGPEASGSGSDWFPKILVGTVIVLAVAFVTLRRWRPQIDTGDEEDVFEIPCAVCRRPIRIRLSQVGKKVPCRYCEYSCTVPGPMSEDVPLVSMRAVKKSAKAMKKLSGRKKAPP
jgi:hypothetical protein